MHRLSSTGRLSLTPLAYKWHRHISLSSFDGGKGIFLRQGRYLCATAAANESERRGVFGLKELKNSGDFEAMSRRAIHRCNEIRSILSSTLEGVESGTCAPSADILLLLDSISNEVCSVIDAAELCRNVHEDDEFRSSAERAFSKLSAYIHELNTDPTLYRSLMTLVDNKEMWASLTEEQRRVAEDLKKEFEADGIHKRDSDEAAEISRLQGQLVETESVFMQNISSAEDAPFKVGPFHDPQYGQQIKHWMAQFTPQDQDAPLIAVSSHKNDGERKSTERGNGLYAICSSRRGVTRGVVSSVADSRLREQAWRGGLEHPKANRRILGRLIKTRQALARELGYESWAEKVLLSSAAGSPQDVWNFLENAAESIREPAEVVLGELSALGDNLNTESGININNRQLGMWPWDVPYYSHMHTALQAQRRKALKDSASTSSWKSNREDSGSGNSSGDASQQAAEYFTLSGAMDALHDLTQSLFGIRLTVAPLGMGEAWAGSGLKHSNYPRSGDKGPFSGVFSFGNSSNSSTSGSTGSVAEVMRSIGNQPFKLEVSAADGSPLGEVLIDLYQRPKKFTGAAHFTIRCGCRVLEDDQYSHLYSRIIRDHKSMGMEEGLSEYASRQLPLVALVFNFPPPASGLLDGLHSPAEAQLSLGDLTTLFHEWGHALHSLLSRTTYQHLSGTRGTLDFVEVPSHLFEYFASEPSLLQRWGRHYATGKPAPAGLFEEALEQRRSTEILEVQGQLLYALCDQYSFGTGIGDVSGDSEEKIFGRVVDGAAMLQQKHTPALLLAPHTGGGVSGGGAGLPDLHLPSHSHAVTYGGSYYSYLFAKMYAAQIWNLQFKEDPLNQSSGQTLLEGLLKYGVSRPPRDMLQAICHGQALDPRYYFQEIS